MFSTNSETVINYLRNRHQVFKQFCVCRVFVDAVVNHMAGLGRSGTGSAGSPFDSDSHDFPGVPYGPDDFTPSELCNSFDGEDNFQLRVAFSQ